MSAPDWLARPPSPLIRRFAERARREPVLLGARLEAIAAARGWDDAMLARQLGTTLDGLTWARLCSVPRHRADCDLIAGRCGLDGGALAALLEAPAAPRETPAHRAHGRE